MRDPKEHGKLRQNYIVHIGPIGYRTILVPVSESTTETVDCIQGDSKNPEECVFPFNYGGRLINSCTTDNHQAS